MKKLESLNNSLFEKFENKRVNNIAAIVGGTYVPIYCPMPTQCIQGGEEQGKRTTDEFTPYGCPKGTTNSRSMQIQDGTFIQGDICYN